MKRAEPRRSVAILRLLLFIVLLLGSFGFFYFQPGLRLAMQDSGYISVMLDTVVDGDTAWFRAAHRERIKVRFIGINAPDSGGSDFFRSGLLAAELLEQAERIELEPDPRTPEDKHGRMLAWVWLSMPDGSKLLLQEEMLRAGQAELYRDAAGSLHFERLRRALP